MSREDWIRFDFYSTRVRKLVLDQPQDVTAQDVYVQLARIHPAPLFPALAALTIASIDDDIVDNLTLSFHCISPSLSSVKLGITKGLKGEMFVVSFLSALSRETISLRELTFQINGPLTSEAIGDLAYLKALETLTLSITEPVSHLNLAKLSEIATLSTLVFKFREEATSTDKPGPFLPTERLGHSNVCICQGRVPSSMRSLFHYTHFSLKSKLSRLASSTFPPRPILFHGHGLPVPR